MRRKMNLKTEIMKGRGGLLYQVRRSPRIETKAGNRVYDISAELYDQIADAGYCPDCAENYGDATPMRVLEDGPYGYVIGCSADCGYEEVCDYELEGIGMFA